MKAAHALARIALIGVYIALAAGCADEPAATPAPVAAPTTGYRVLGELDFGLLPEASGMSVSRVDNNRLWFVNDTGNAANLIALDKTTMAATRVAVTGARNRDWEDLAGFTLADEPWLLIADVGDNNAVRSSVRLIFVREPIASDASATDDALIVNLRYPNGPRDVESVAVDVAGDSIYLLSKRNKPPVLYRVPLQSAMTAARSGQAAAIVAERLGEVTSIPAPTALELSLFPEVGRYRSQPTAMELSPDGRQLAVLTYGEAYLVTIAPGRDWLAALNGALDPLGLPVLAQAETIAIGADGVLYVSTERRNAPLLGRSLADRAAPCCDMETSDEQ